MKITIDPVAICFKCGRKGAITDIEKDGEVVKGKAVCLDCLREWLKR